MMTSARRVAGFTAIELVAVLGLLTLTGGIAANGVLGAQRRGAINAAVGAVEKAATHARALARGSSGGDNHRLIIDGGAATKGVRIERGGEVLHEVRFGPQVRLTIDGDHFEGVRELYFVSGTGFTADRARGRGRRATVGTDEVLGLETPDGAIRVGVQIYGVGLVSSRELDP